MPKRKAPVRKPWTKEDLRELKAHSKARTPVAQVAKAMKRTEAAVRQPWASALTATPNSCSASKYPLAKPGALGFEPLKAAWGLLARPGFPFSKSRYERMPHIGLLRSL